MSKRGCLNAIFICIIALAPISLFAQGSPTVGLVLSGGGAKGFAHVGALKIIEEAGIRVDYIGGTSAGAIVGGLYAAGWSAGELDSLLHSIDLQALVADEAPRELKSYFDKQHGEKYVLSLSLKDFQISLPAGFSNGQMLFNKFSELTERVRFVRDFNLLPIPFLCVTTEVATGREVVLRKGTLPQAMLASGAFPGLFAPVEIDGKLYTDGGLVNNFPLEEVRKMGADIIIGVSVEEGLLEEEDLQSVPSIISQISSYRMAERSQAQYEIADLIISPNTKGFGVTSFGEVDTLITNGELAAREHWIALRDIALKQQQGLRARAVYSPPRPIPSDSLKIDKVVIKNIDSNTAYSLSKALPSDLQGEFSIQQFNEAINRSYALGQYKNIFYRFEEKEGQEVLEIEPILDPGFKKQVRLGLHYDRVYKTSFLVNLTWLDFLFPNSRASLDFIIGDRLRHDFNYFHERDGGIAFGLRSRAQYNQFDFKLPNPLQLDQVLLEEIQFDFWDFSNEIYTHFWNNLSSAVGLAVQLKYFRNKPNQIATLSTGDPLSGSTGWYLAPRLFFHADTQNDRHFPTRGLRTQAKAQFIYNFSEDDSSTAGRKTGFNVDFSLEAVTSLSNKMTLGYSIDVGTNFDNTHVPFFYLLGSLNENLINNFKPFPGLEFGQVFGTAIAGGGLNSRYALFPNQFLTIGGKWTYIRDFSDLMQEQDRYVYGAYASYALRTALGPIALVYGYSNEGSEWYFNLGHWF